jgi:poly(A) polymerase
MEALPPDELKPPPLITGDDLIAAGYKPGPPFSRILSAVEDAQLESRIRSYEEAMALVRAQFPAE